MNWHERIEAAKRRGGFTDEDQHLTIDWVTCACGEQDMRIKRDYDGRPQDPRLIILGATFCGDVSANDYDEAAITLKLIETRTAELLAEIAP